MILGEPTVEEKTANRKIISVATSVAITLSAALIMGLIAINSEAKKEAVIIAKVVSVVEAPKPKMQKKSVQKMAKQAASSAASAMSTSMIRANTAAVISMPKVTVVNDGPLGLGEGDFGDGFGSGMGGGGMGSMKGLGRRIGGMSVKAKKLGVVLDISGSMTKHLEKLRKEIKKEFKDAVFREVTGCRLDVGDGNIEELDPKTTQRDSVLLAMRELAEIQNVDAVFWFCDLNDGETEEGLAELEASFWHGNPPVHVSGKKSEFSGLDELKRLQDTEMKLKETEPCRLYIRSVGRRAEKPLLKLLKASGGSFKRA